MNYYHLTADIDDFDDAGVQPAVAVPVASTLRTDEDDDDDVNDPNWLIIQPPPAEQQLPRPQPPPVIQPSSVKVRLRPKQKNLSHRISARLSQLLWTSHAEDAPSSSASFEDANAEYHQHLPSGSKVNNDDHVAQKITEIFGSFHDDSSSGGANEETSVQTMQPPPVQPQQRPQRRNRRSGNPLRQQRNRHLNTVSTYFNDWTQWLTSNEKMTINGYRVFSIARLL